MLPTTIDGVIQRLDELVDQSLLGASRLGYFAALYRRVTLTVRDMIGQGYFDDDARMERLDVTFANRYLAAVDDYVAGGPGATAPWKLAFDALGNRHLIILQHLMLGMNAHIELDLGVACAEVAPGDLLPGLQGDFEKINTLLAALSPLVEEEIGDLSPLIAGAEKIGRILEKPIVDTAMAVARSTAWGVATELAPLTPEERVPRIAARAAKVAGWSGDIDDPPLIVEAALKAIELAESDDVRAIVRCLGTREVITFDGHRIVT